MAFSGRSTMFRRYPAFVAALILLSVSPVSVSAFWSSSNEKETKKEASFVANESNGVPPTETPVSYGVDVSFPMHHSKVSDNFAWLPHNVDPGRNDVPPEYQDMVVQPLGDKNKEYNDFLNGCKEKWGNTGAHRCQQNENDRIAMTLRQPQSMQVRYFFRSSPR